MRGLLIWRGRTWWGIAIEAGIWLAAAYLLLAQIGCVQVEGIPATPQSLRLSDATFRPAFVTQGRSLPAEVRYWVALDEPVTVTWSDVQIGTACNLCSIQTCESRVSTVNPPTVSVRHRPPVGDGTVEDARFPLLLGCPSPAGRPPVFTPTETGQFLAHLSVPGVEPIPSQPGAWLPVNVLSASFTLPPRRLQRAATGGDAWEWRARGGTGAVKEAFDPRLRVGRVRVLVGTCAAPAAEPRDDECGMDGLMDPAFTVERVIAPHYVRAQANLASLQDCRGVASAMDGDIDLGPDPDSPGSSRCRPQNNLVFVTPNFQSQENAAGLPITWRVEFSEAAGFPPPDPGRQLWIEFTLVPAR